jgi:hypothetical protein
MEAFESFVALAMQTEGLVVAGPFKFKIGYLQKGPKPSGWQDTPYEIDLIGASRDRLVLATVKSFFGSGGVFPNEVMGVKGKIGGYRMINDPVVSTGLVTAAAEFFGYDESKVEVRLYAGKYAGNDGEEIVREWASKQILGGGPLKVYNIAQVVGSVRAQAQLSTYSDNPALVAMKAIMAEQEYVAKAEKAATVQVNSGSASRPSERNWRQVEIDFPLSSVVQSKKDGFTGVVVGYSNQGTPKPYVAIIDNETGVSRIRSAATLELVSFGRR